MPKPLKYLLFFLAAVSVMVVGYYQFANCAGRRAWKHARAELTEKGEPVTRPELKARLISSVAPERNFCAVSPLDGIAVVVEGDPEAGAPAMKRKKLEALLPPDQESPIPPAGDFRADRNWDFEAWGTYLETNVAVSLPLSAESPMEKLGEILERDAWLFDALDEANDRPEAIFLPSALQSMRDDGSDPFRFALPHAGAMHRVAAMLELRAAFSVRQGKEVSCRESLISLYRVAEAEMNQKTWMNLLLGQTALDRADDPLYRYLKRSLYESDQDLADLNEALAKLDLAHSFCEATRTECVAFVTTEEEVEEIDCRLSDAEKWALNWGPSGWVDQNCANYCNVLQSVIGRESAGLAEMLSSLKSEQRKFSKRFLGNWHHVWMARRGWAVAESVLRGSLYSEALRRQQLAAIALERHRLKTGGYPVSLPELDRQFVVGPLLDPIDGQPLRYRRTPAGYMLYSIGFDRSDDGGNTPLTPKKEKARKYVPPFRSPDYRGDWVWEMKRETEAAVSGE